MATTADDAHLLVRHGFDAEALVAAHLPRLTHKHKKLVHAIACPPGSRHAGQLVFSRWRAMPLPDALPARDVAHEVREDVFGYEPPQPGAVEWYLNFADASLFVAYGGPLLAQDELQVAEHPALGSLREALKASADPRFAPLTHDSSGPTPILVRGVERRCAIATDPDLLEGRPGGLYGNRFARASEDTVRRAVKALSPPTISNILAIQAPPGGDGFYSIAEIEGVFTTAYTGFRAAKAESALAAASATVTIHTGHWGTGAYGGNKVLMAMIQMLSARLAGIDWLVFHTFDPAGSEAWQEAKGRLDELAPAGKEATMATIIGALHAMGFVWGVSDGN